MESKQLNGSEFLSNNLNTRDSKFSSIARITDWRIVSPLEFKLKEMSEAAINKEKDLKT